MACEIEPVDRVAARLIIAGRVIALRGVAHIVLAGDRAIFAGHSLAVLDGLLADAQLLDLSLRALLSLKPSTTTVIRSTSESASSPIKST